MKISDIIENRNKEILSKIPQEEAEFLMEQTVSRQIELTINHLYNKDLLIFLKGVIEDRMMADEVNK